MFARCGAIEITTIIIITVSCLEKTDRWSSCCTSVFFPWGGDSSSGRPSDWKAKGNTDRGLSPQCSKGCFTAPRVSFQQIHSYDVQTPLCTIICVNICADITILMQWQSYHCLDTRKYYTLTRMGSTAPAAAVPYPGKATQISCKGQWSNEEIKITCSGFAVPSFMSW